MKSFDELKIDQHELENFESNVLINSLKSFDEDSEHNDEFCENCMKIFNFKVNYSNSNLENLLHEEIVQFEEKVNAITMSKSEMFRNLITDLRNVIFETLNINYEIYTYGSYANGLNLPWSDIDLLIEFNDSKDPKIYLDKLEKAFAKTPHFLDSKFIRFATIPVLKLTTDQEYGNTKIDITIKESTHSGLNCVNLVKQYLIFYKPLKPVTLVLKQLLHKISLNDPYLGGLSSYGLILMIVAFFQSLILKNIYYEIEENFGKILIEFLRFYSTNFDYVNNQIMPCYPDELMNPFPYVN